MADNMLKASVFLFK